MKEINEYYKIAGDILTNEHFLELKNDIHHGTNKYDHCKRVSYISYRLAKLFKADTKEVIRAGLLHDFFFGQRTDKDENSYLNHPNTSVINAKKYFDITEKEEDDIKTHMFHHVIVKKLVPFVNYKEKAKLKEHKPKSKEGAIICFADFLVSVYEFERFKLSYTFSIIALFIMNILTIK